MGKEKGKKENDIDTDTSAKIFAGGGLEQWDFGEGKWYHPVLLVLHCYQDMPCCGPLAWLMFSIAYGNCGMLQMQWNGGFTFIVFLGAHL